VPFRRRNASRDPLRAGRYRAEVLAYVVAIAVAIVVVPVTNGSITRLAEVRFRRAWLLVLGLALQLLLDVVDVPKARYEDVGVAVVLVSYLALLGFCASNLRTRGIELIGIGIALNAIVIALNLGMPYKVADGLPRETTVRHRPTRHRDVAVFLSDQIVIGDPIDAAISAGDIVLAVGIVELAYLGSRRPRRRGSTHPVIDLTASDEIDLRAARAAQPSPLSAPSAPGRSGPGSGDARFVRR
jgi:hypothetical protein